MSVCKKMGESRFNVSLEYWKMSTKIKNDSVTNCFCATLIRIKSNLFAEKLGTKLGTKLEVVCYIKMLQAKIMKLSVTLSSSTWIPPINPQGFAQISWEILQFKV